MLSMSLFFFIYCRGDVVFQGALYEIITLKVCTRSFKVIQWRLHMGSRRGRCFLKHAPVPRPHHDLL